MVLSCCLSIARRKKSSLVLGVASLKRCTHWARAWPQVLDLESLQFEGGAHFLASKSVHLPQETFKRTGQGYEEARTDRCFVSSCFAPGCDTLAVLAVV
jgi:hypothetical protein